MNVGLDLDSGNPINVDLHYDGQLLQLTLTDTVSTSIFQTNIPVNIPAFVGSNISWIEYGQRRQWYIHIKS